MPTSITSGQGSQWKRFVSDIVSASSPAALKELKKLGFDRDSLQRVFGKGPVLKKLFTEFLVEQVQSLALEGYHLARSILGDDLIIPEEIMEARSGISYSCEEQAKLLATLPPRKELEILKKGGYLLIAGPPKPLSLLGVRALKAEYFKNFGWLDRGNERFLHDEQVGQGWHKIRKEALPHSFLKDYAQQQELVSDGEFLPNDAMVEWVITTYHAVRDVYLLRWYMVRTASRIEYLRRPVCVGRFDSTGLEVSVSPWGDKCPDVGVLFARR